MFSEYFLQCLWAVTSLLAAITPDKRFLGVVDLYIRTVLGNRESFCGLWSLSDLPGKSMKKRTHSLAIAPCYHCNTDHFDWLERDDLARSLPPAYRWMRVENRSTDKRCTDCWWGWVWREAWWQTVSCTSSSMRALCLAHSIGIYTTRRRSILIEQGKQKCSLCLAVSLTFFCSVLIQFPARQERASLS